MMTMKPGTITTVEALAVGDLFTLTPGGVWFEKLPGKSPEGNCIAKVCGSGDRDHQSLSKNFPVYFLKHKPNDKNTPAKKLANYIQPVLFNPSQQ